MLAAYSNNRWRIGDVMEYGRFPYTEKREPPVILSSASERISPQTFCTSGNSRSTDCRLWRSLGSNSTAMTRPPDAARSRVISPWPAPISSHTRSEAPRPDSGDATPIARAMRARHPASLRKCCPSRWRDITPSLTRQNLECAGPGEPSLFVSYVHSMAAAVDRSRLRKSPCSSKCRVAIVANTSTGSQWEESRIQETSRSCGLSSYPACITIVLVRIFAREVCLTKKSRKSKKRRISAREFKEEFTRIVGSHLAALPPEEKDRRIRAAHRLVTSRSRGASATGRAV